MTVTDAQAATFERCMSVGGIAVFPADTVYGLACDAGNTGDAIRRLYALKRRPLDKPSAVMFFDLRDGAGRRCPSSATRTRGGAARLLPGPGHACCCPTPSGGSRWRAAADPATLGLRVPLVPGAAPACAGRCCSPARTSPAGRRRGRLDEVPEPLRAQADLVIDGGELPGTPSTVIDLRDYERRGRLVDRARRRGLRGRRRCGAARRSTTSTPTTYDEMIQGDIPAYDELQRRLELASGDGARRILELGTGTGETARRLLRRHPDATLVGVDDSGSMLAVARDRLADDRVSLVVSRLEEPLPDGPFDLVASALAVHHLASADKRALFARVRATLAAGGRFVLADVIVPVNPAEAHARR